MSFLQDFVKVAVQCLMLGKTVQISPEHKIALSQVFMTFDKSERDHVPKMPKMLVLACGMVRREYMSKELVLHSLQCNVSDFERVYSVMYPESLWDDDVFMFETNEDHEQKKVSFVFPNCYCTHACSCSPTPSDSVLHLLRCNRLMRMLCCVNVFADRVCPQPG